MRIAASDFPAFIRQRVCPKKWTYCSLFLISRWIRLSNPFEASSTRPSSYKQKHVTKSRRGLLCSSSGDIFVSRSKASEKRSSSKYQEALAYSIVVEVRPLSLIKENTSPKSLLGV